MYFIDITERPGRIIFSYGMLVNESFEHITSMQQAPELEETCPWDGEGSKSKCMMTCTMLEI